jgi:hypothetical protein
VKLAAEDGVQAICRHAGLKHHILTYRRISPSPLSLFLDVEHLESANQDIHAGGKPWPLSSPTISADVLKHIPFESAAAGMGSDLLVVTSGAPCG